MKKGSLPIFGVEPFYFMSILSITIISIILDRHEILPQRKWYFQEFWVTIGVFLIISGIFLWMKVVVFQRIDQKIKENQLITTGIYGYVRNPIYSAFLFLCTGIIIIANNMCLMILPILYYLFLTILMQKTEER